MNKNKIKVYIRKQRRKIIRNERNLVDFSLFPEEPGNYILWNSDDVIYTGESNDLNRRVRQLLSGAHIFNKKIRKEKDFGGEMAKKYIVENFKISFLVNYLGRKELEEYLLKRDDFPYNHENNKKFD